MAAAFPTTYVMSVIDGYSRGLHSAVGGVMPEFGELLKGRQVLYDERRAGRRCRCPSGC